MENLNSLNRRSENVVIKAVIIAELELSDIEREILGADLVERADDPALEDAPKEPEVASWRSIRRD
jgi:transposase-like protein